MQQLPAIRSRCAALIGVGAVLVMLLAGCAATPGAQQLAKQQTFIYPITPIIPSSPHAVVYPDLELDPAFASDVYSQNVLNMIEVQLVTFDNNLNVIPDAANWTVSPDNKTWTFKLRDGLKWNDGTPLTAQDFLTGIEHDLDPNLCGIDSPFNDPDPANRTPCNGSQSEGFFLSYIAGANAYANADPANPLKSIQGIQVLDAQTIVFTLTAPISFFLYDLATMAGMPLETSLYQKYGANYALHYPEGVGQSGPFQIASWSDPTKSSSQPTPQTSTQIRFVRNPNWWGKKPALNEIDMPIYTTQSDQYAAYVNGTVDYANEPSSEYPFTQELNDFHQIQTLSIDYFQMNWLDAPFTDLRVRQAFDLALNKQLLVDTVFKGARTPTNHIIPLGIPGHNPNLHSPPDNSASASVTGDQTTAAQLIAQVANGCNDRYDPSLCPYIVGTPPLTTAVQSLYPSSTNCPQYKVGVSGSPAATTQLPINIYVSPSNPDRATFVKDAAQVLSNTLCLNIVAKVDSSFRKVIDSVFGKPTNYPMWTLGYAADYPDPQDFTTNLFDPQSFYNAANLNTDNDPQLVAQMHAADTEQDQLKRIADYEQIEQQLVDQVAMIPFDQAKYLYRLKTNVVSFVVPSDQVVPDQDWPDVHIVS